MPARRDSPATARNVPAVPEFSLYSVRRTSIGSAERSTEATMSPLIRRRIFACATVLGFLSLVRADFSAVEPGPPRSSGAVHALFDLDAFQYWPISQRLVHGRRSESHHGRWLDLLRTDCSVSTSHCEDLEVINTPHRKASVSVPRSKEAK